MYKKKMEKAYERIEKKELQYNFNYRYIIKISTNVISDDLIKHANVPPIVRYLHMQRNVYSRIEQLFSVPLRAKLKEELVILEARIQSTFIAFVSTILQKQSRSVLDAKGQQLARVNSAVPFIIYEIK